MKQGFPDHMNIIDLLDLYDEFKQHRNNTNTNQKEFCSKLLRACDLKWCDFKIGSTQIFFRKGKFELLAENLKSGPKEVLLRLDKQDGLRKKLKIHMIILLVIAKFLTIVKKNQNNIDTELHVVSSTAAEVKKVSRIKKRKPHAPSDHSGPSSKRPTGIL